MLRKPQFGRILVIATTALFAVSTHLPAASASTSSETRGGSLHSPSRYEIENAVLFHIRNAKKDGSTIHTQGGAERYAHWEIKIKSDQPGREMPVALAECANPNGRCTIKKTLTQTAEVSANADVTLEILKVQGGVKYSESVTTEISCTSPILTHSQRYVARPMGNFLIFDWAYVRPWPAPRDTGSGTAFYPKGFSCRVMSKN